MIKWSVFLVFLCFLVRIFQFKYASVEDCWNCGWSKLSATLELDIKRRVNDVWPEILALQTDTRMEPFFTSLPSSDEEKNRKIGSFSEKRLKQYRRRLNWRDSTRDVNQPTLKQFLDDGCTGLAVKAFKNDNILYPWEADRFVKSDWIVKFQNPIRYGSPSSWSDLDIEWTPENFQSEEEFLTDRYGQQFCLERFRNDTDTDETLEHLDSEGSAFERLLCRPEDASMPYVFEKLAISEKAEFKSIYYRDIRRLQRLEITDEKQRKHDEKEKKIFDDAKARKADAKQRRQNRQNALEQMARKQEFDAKQSEVNSLQAAIYESSTAVTSGIKITDEIQKKHDLQGVIILSGSVG